ncbi:hypothetical protein GUJ93_ZPchr0010g8080 [Zizania palustris]|uniref:Uncharacterized protein n=1 Tax=Zizania palustris TaxID=103762 RepID=A0A8J5WD59_ZIZPA|nr:hypothetical protein GUJ93_ZPchr0010g8080 [Zizania palustris]
MDEGEPFLDDVLEGFDELPDVPIVDHPMVQEPQESVELSGVSSAPSLESAVEQPPLPQFSHLRWPRWDPLGGPRPPAPLVLSRPRPWSPPGAPRSGSSTLGVGGAGHPVLPLPRPRW